MRTASSKSKHCFTSYFSTCMYVCIFITTTISLVSKGSSVWLHLQNWLSSLYIFRFSHLNYKVDKEEILQHDQANILGGYRNKNLGKFLWQLLKKGLWIKRNFFFELDMGEMDRNLGHIARVCNSTNNDSKSLQLVTMTTSLKCVRYKVLALQGEKKMFFESISISLCSFSMHPFIRQ